MPSKISSIKKFFHGQAKAAEKELGQRKTKHPSHATRPITPLSPSLYRDEPPYIYWTKAFCLPTRAWIKSMKPDQFSWVYQELLVEFTRRDPGPFTVLEPSPRISSQSDMSVQARKQVARWFQMLDIALINWLVEEMYGDLQRRMRILSEPRPRVQDIDKYQLEVSPIPPLFSPGWGPPPSPATAGKKTGEPSERDLRKTMHRMSQALESLENLGEEEEENVSNILKTPTLQTSFENLGNNEGSRFSTFLDTVTEDDLAIAYAASRTDTAASSSETLVEASIRNPYEELIHIADQDFTWMRAPGGEEHALGSGTDHDCAIRRKATPHNTKGGKRSRAHLAESNEERPRPPLPRARTNSPPPPPPSLSSDYSSGFQEGGAAASGPAPTFAIPRKPVPAPSSASTSARHLSNKPTTTRTTTLGAGTERITCTNIPSSSSSSSPSYSST